jgi:hypothetical protein
MRAAFVIVALIVPVIALALPDDATLSRLLVGTWHGHRHDTQYRADGTWIENPLHAEPEQEMILHGKHKNYYMDDKLHAARALDLALVAALAICTIILKNLSHPPGMPRRHLDHYQKAARFSESCGFYWSLS